MSLLASRTQLRMSFLRWALVTVPLIMLLGFLSGQIAVSGDENAWYRALVKPEAQPPGPVFGIVWPILYFLMGLSLAIVLNARGAALRWPAVGLFLVQLVLNLFWSPLFFGIHQVGAALGLSALLVLLVAATIFLFMKVRKAAAWLLVPYLLWLCFATYLTWRIDRLNPDAETLYVPAATTQI